MSSQLGSSITYVRVTSISFTNVSFLSVPPFQYDSLKTCTKHGIKSTFRRFLLLLVGVRTTEKKIEINTVGVLSVEETAKIASRHDVWQAVC